VEFAVIVYMVHFQVLQTVFFTINAFAAVVLDYFLPPLTTRSKTIFIFAHTAL